MSESDLRSLFAAHSKALHSSLLHKAGDPQLAADLTQESFLRLTERYGKEPIDNIPGWLHRTAHNLLIDHFRRQRRHRTEGVPHEILNEIEEPGPGLEEQTITERSLQHLRDAVAELPERTQQIFRLNRLEGLTYAEVARRLGISDSSVQKHLAKALAHVMRRLQERP